MVESCSLNQCTATNVYCGVHCFCEQMHTSFKVHSMGITLFIAVIWKTIGWVVALWIWKEDLAVGF